MMADTEGNPAGAHVNAGRDLSMQNSNIVGGDYTHTGDNVGRDKVTKTNIRIGLGALVILFVGGGGYLVAKEVTSAPTDVVYEQGLGGATHTVAAIKQAEIDSNAADWCTLVSAQSGDTCRTLMSSSFGSMPELRKEIPEVQFGAATGSGNAAQVTVTFKGKEIGSAPMRWDGKRWAVDQPYYMFTVNNGGLAMSAVLAYHGCGAIAGITTGCKK
jgi:hypothetical protein